jgi:ribosomal protein S18 acetylase RimI-like enzyme
LPSVFPGATLNGVIELNGGIESRVLTSSDWKLWRELRLAALAEAPHAFGSTLSDWTGDGDREARWRARLEIPGSHNVVAVLDRHAVGMVSGVPSNEDSVVELISMWVSPAVRGRGFGDHLIGAVDQWARRSGATIVKLAVRPDNHPAILLYQRNGFVATGELGELTPDGITREHVMAKAITS